MTIVMYRGDDTAFPFTLTQGGLPVDLTDWTLLFSATTDIDGAALFVRSSEVAYGAGFEIDIDPAQTTTGKGKIVVNIESANTVDLARNTLLLCDIEGTDDDGLIHTFPEPSTDQSTLIRLRIRGDVTIPA